VQTLHACRRRGELTGTTLLSLRDPSWNILDLNACSHLSPSSILKALKPLKHLRQLDLSDCSLTNEIVYALPGSVPQLQLLRMRGAHQLVERSAWHALVPKVLSGCNIGSWEDAEAEEPVRYCSCITFSAGRVHHCHACMPCVAGDLTSPTPPMELCHGTVHCRAR
jgi:hypothetical protein